MQRQREFIELLKTSGCDSGSFLCFFEVVNVFKVLRTVCWFAGRGSVRVVWVCEPREEYAEVASIGNGGGVSA